MKYAAPIAIHGHTASSARTMLRTMPSSDGRRVHASAAISAGPIAADSLLMKARTLATRLITPNRSDHVRLAMNAHAATSIHRSAMPSKRAAIQDTASALGANHANARPEATAAFAA